MASLITAINDGGPEPAGALNPEALALGAAFETTFAAMQRAPDTIWLSSEAVGAFINALASGTNAPLYSNLAANFTAAGERAGRSRACARCTSRRSTTRARTRSSVRRPASRGPRMGRTPSRWTSRGQAGRDVAIVGMVWHIPWYPEAFTLYNVTS